MNLEESFFNDHFPPELRLLKAQRLHKLFRLSITLGITCVGFGLFWVAYQFFGIGFRNEIFDYYWQVAPMVATISAFAFLGSLVPLTLEVGGKPISWVAIYREARGTLDRDQAQKLEEKRFDRLRKESSRGWSASTNDSDSQGIEGESSIEPPANTLTALRASTDLHETERWTSENYAALTRAIIERLQSEVGTQGGRANINLGIALVVASVGVMILAWLSWNVSEMLLAPPPKNDYAVMLYGGAFAAKLTLALSANVFAFFFLATYRRNLSEIRYFHNELTNVQTRILALYFAADQKLDSPMASAIKALSATERNFIIKKGESTTDLSLKNLDSTDVTTLSGLLKEMIQTAQKK